MRDMLLVISMEEDYARDIARKLRREGYFCRLAPREVSAEEVQALGPSGLVLAGSIDGRSFGTPMDMRLTAMGLPVLAMGDSATEMAVFLGAQAGEPRQVHDALRVRYGEDPLFAGLEASDRWFETPEGWALTEDLVPIAWALEDSPVGYVDPPRHLYGLQFQIEHNDPDGTAILRNFAQGICGCTPWWTTEAIAERCQAQIADALSEEGQLLCLVSGGVDSAVCAALAARAAGDRVRCVLVDTGLMRQGEVEEVQRLYREDMRQEAFYIDASRQTFSALAGVADSAGKTRVVGDIYEQAVAVYARQMPQAELLVQGTNYTELLDRGLYPEAFDPPACGPLQVLEPLRDLFKEEVRELGALLELPDSLLLRQSFPGAGLALRLTGPIDEGRVILVRKADAILREEILAAGQGKRLTRYFALMMPMPLGQAEGEIVVLRAVQHGESDATAARLPYDLLERVVSRIMAEVPGVQRVVYDLTAGDMGKIEW